MNNLKFALAVVPFFLVLTAIFSGCNSKADCEPFTVSAINEFAPSEKEGYAPFYIHRGIDALAVNSEEYENEYAIADYIFSRKSGKYNIKITTVLEDDGESTYKLFINDKKVAEIQNDESSVNYVEHIYDYGNFELKQGDVISIAFNNLSNGKIPEDEVFAFARGRWKNLIIAKVCE